MMRFASKLCPLRTDMPLAVTMARNSLRPRSSPSWSISAPNQSLSSASMPNLPFHLGSRRSSRSEEHTSELQSHLNLVCRLLLEKKKKANEAHTLHGD